MPGDPGIIILIALRYPFCELSVNCSFCERSTGSEYNILWSLSTDRVVINKKDTYLQSKLDCKEMNNRLVDEADLKFW